MAEVAVVTFGLRRDVGPEQALLEEVQWTAGHVAWLRAQVQALDADELSDGVPGLVRVYGEYQDRLVNVCRAAAAVGVSERLVRLAESQGRALVAGLQELLLELDLSPEQLARWRVGLPRMLRRLTAGEIEGQAS